MIHVDHRFVTLFITQTYKELVEKANLNLRRKDTETAILKRKAYFILDEFGNLPKLENIEGMVTVGRSFVACDEYRIYKSAHL